jgi:hypothetical protein
VSFGSNDGEDGAWTTPEKDRGVGKIVQYPRCAWKILMGIPSMGFDMENFRFPSAQGIECDEKCETGAVGYA